MLDADECKAGGMRVGERIKWLRGCSTPTPTAAGMLRDGLIAPAERWPYEPVALELRDAFMIDVSEFGEKRIMELMSNMSE